MLERAGSERTEAGKREKKRGGGSEGREPRARGREGREGPRRGGAGLAWRQQPGLESPAGSLTSSRGPPPAARLWAARSSGAPALFRLRRTDRGTGRPSPGPPAEAGRWRGGDRGRGTSQRWGHGDIGARGLGFPAPGSVFCSSRLTFHRCRGSIPSAPLGSGLRKSSLARGGGGCQGLGKRRGVWAERGAPRRGPSGRSREAAPGAVRPERNSAARLSSGEPPARPPTVWGLPPRSRPWRAVCALSHGCPPCGGRGT